MSVVTVQVGQCGNQLGMELFDTLYPDLLASRDQSSLSSSNPCEIFFNESQITNGKHYARAVLLDMEPKVIQNCLAKTKTWDHGWCYSSRRQLVRQHGSGNNWAYGYSVHGAQVYEQVQEIVRKEVEACDYFGGILLLHSAAGGTGSGLGSYLTERLRDAFPDGPITNTVVWPHDTGEVVVQGYNTVLTMAHLAGGSASGSHAILNMFNDNAHRVCQDMLHIARPSLSDLNKVMARDLALALLPSNPSQTDSFTGSDVLGTIVEQLCPNPNFKFLEQKSVPQMSKEMIEFSSHSWPAIIKHLHEMHISGKRIDIATRNRGQIANKSVALQLTVRGESARAFCSAIAKEPSVALDLPQHERVVLRNLSRSRREKQQGELERSTIQDELQKFQNHGLYPSWADTNDRFQLRVQETPRLQGVVGGYERIASLLSNSQTIVAPLDRAVDKATNMWDAQAYVHQYAKFGVDNNHFAEAFMKIEQVIADYSTL